MYKIDFLKPYIPNLILRLISYLFILPFGLALIISFWYIILGLAVIYIGYKNIQDEKIKWTVISVITVALIVSGIINQKPKEEISKTNKTQESQSQTQAQTQPSTQISVEQKIEKPNEELFLVTKVIDGDTIEIEGGKRVRYIGIDTPETVDPNRPVGCYGKEASNKNSELVLNKKVKLVKDVSETDRYGRLLRYVYIENNFVNDNLVKEGYAKASTYAPDVKYSEQFATSEREARENKRGLWGSACEVNTVASPTVSFVTPATYIVPKQTVTSQINSYSSSGVVKKSTTGICHAPGTTYYNKTKNFTAYQTVEDCLNSGGRLPKR